MVAIAGAVTIEWLRSRRVTAGDQALALVFYTGIAAGVVLVSAAGALDVDLFSFLFGSILTTTRTDLAVVAALGVAALATVAILYRALAAVVIDEEGARVAGLPIAALNVTVAVLAAVTVAVSMRIVGILLIAALMVLPVIAATRDRVEHALDPRPLVPDRSRLRARRPHDRLLRRSAARGSDRPDGVRCVPRHGRHRSRPRRLRPWAHVSRSLTVNVLMMLLLVVVATTVIGIVVLWPDDRTISQAEELAPPRTQQARVVGVTRGTVRPRQPLPRASVSRLRSRTGHGRRSRSPGSGSMLAVGDRIRVYRNPEPAQALPGVRLDEYGFSDFERRSPLLLLGGIFAALVLLTGRWQGLRALLGLAASLVLIVFFVVPAILSGESPHDRRPRRSVRRDARHDPAGARARPEDPRRPASEPPRHSS